MKDDEPCAMARIDEGLDFDRGELDDAEETLAVYAPVLDGVTIRQCAIIRRMANGERDCLAGYDDPKPGTLAALLQEFPDASPDAGTVSH